MDELRATQLEALVNRRWGISILLAMLSFPFLPMLWQTLVLTLWQACFHNIWTSQLEQIKPGMTKREVIRLFGTPRHDSKDKYLIYSRDFDKTVHIFFNDDGTVEMITI